MARLTREDYLRAGLDLLGETGSAGLTIAALCEHLSITKGSFYHHFDGMPGYTAALLEYWETEFSRRPIERIRTDDGVFQVPTLTDIAVHLPHATEAALRAWGSGNPDVAEVQARVDAARRAQIASTLRDLGIPAATADLLADLSLSVLIGFQHQPDPDPARLAALLAEVNRLIYLEAAED